MPASYNEHFVVGSKSPSVSGLLKPCTVTRYKFEYRGEIEAKGKGKVKMYFVEE